MLPKIRELKAVAGRPKGFLNKPRLLPSNRSLPKPPRLPLKGAEMSLHTLTPGHNIVRRHYGSNNNRSLGPLRRPQAPHLGRSKGGLPPVALANKMTLGNPWPRSGGKLLWKAALPLPRPSLWVRYTIPKVKGGVGHQEGYQSSGHYKGTN